MWRLCNCRPGWAERSSVNYKSAIWYFPSRLRSKLSRKTRAEIGLKIHEPVRNSCGLRNFHSVFRCCAAALHFKMSARQKDFSTHTHTYECIRQYYLWIVEFFHAFPCCAVQHSALGHNKSVKTRTRPDIAVWPFIDRWLGQLVCVIIIKYKSVLFLFTLLNVRLFFAISVEQIKNKQMSVNCQKITLKTYRRCRSPAWSLVCWPYQLVWG